MKKLNIAIIFAIVISLFISCFLVDTEGSGDMTEVKMTAQITAIGDRIEVEVIEGEYDASGPFWVITGIDTKFFDADGNKISLSSLNVGDKVEITYGGQVMMSYPPQIVAKKIQIK